MLNSGGNSSSSPAAECFMTILNTSSGTTSDISKRKNCRSKRRFSDDQIRSLEIMFETKTKLEPRRKLQLARELELQPRQVAVWFQNKRARWKSKQLERDYSLLCSHYNNLASQFESLEKEKRSLLEQLQRLNDLIGKSEKEGEELYNCRHGSSAAEPGNGAGPVVVISNDIGAGNVESCTRDQKLIDDKQSLYFERSAYGSVIGDQVLSDDDDDDKSSRTNNPDFPGFEEEETQLSNRAEPADTSLTSPAEWNRLDSNALLEDQPSSSYKWWDFWS